VLQCQRLVEVVEQALAGAEDDRGDRDGQLFDVAGAEGLADDVGAAMTITSLSPAASRALVTASSRPFTKVSRRRRRGRPPGGG
jgi:hypothetical protein